MKNSLFIEENKKENQKVAEKSEKKDEDKQMQDSQILSNLSFLAKKINNNLQKKMREMKLKRKLKVKMIFQV